MTAAREVVIDGVRYRPVDEAKAAEVGQRLREFASEGTTYWRNIFIDHDQKRRQVAFKVEDGMIVMYVDGVADTNYGFGCNFEQVKDRLRASGESYGVYDEGDEFAPFFSEAFLYNLLGKDEARSVLGIVRRLSELAGVKFR